MRLCQLLFVVALMPFSALAGPMTASAPAPAETVRAVVELEAVKIDGDVQLPVALIVPRTRFRHGPTSTELRLLARAGLAVPKSRR